MKTKRGSSGRRSSISDEQWSLISLRMKLPMAARADLQSTIALYLKFRGETAKRMPIADVKKQLKKATQSCDGLLRCLGSLDDRSISAIKNEGAAPSSSRLRHEWWLAFVDLRKQIKTLRDRCENASKRVVSDKPGPAAVAYDLAWFVYELRCFLLRYQPRRLRAEKTITDFVFEICTFVDPKVRDGSVKRAIAESRDWARYVKPGGTSLKDIWHFLENS